MLYLFLVDFPAMEECVLRDRDHLPGDLVPPLERSTILSASAAPAL
ncbi:MAG: hypothetical protein WBE85_01290 [Methylocella sp.]